VNDVNGFDIALLVLVGVALFLGLAKGLTRLLIGTGALIAAFMLAAQFHQAVAMRLTWIDVSENVLKLIAYLLIFLGTMLAGGLVAWLLRELLKAAMLSWADRLAGGAVGVVAATLIAALLILPLVAYSPFGERALRESVLAPYVTVVADLARRLVPRDLSDSYQEKVEGLRQYWRERWQQAPELEAHRFTPAGLA
jgi:membrane protein required for colicin V production